jgi:hypothetical protein
MVKSYPCTEWNLLKMYTYAKTIMFEEAEMLRYLCDGSSECFCLI